LLGIYTGDLLNDLFIDCRLYLLLDLLNGSMIHHDLNKYEPKTKWIMDG
jgi:hypothetical protein